MAGKDAKNDNKYYNPKPPSKTEISENIIKSLSEHLIPMHNKISFVYDEMIQLKSQTEEALKIAKQALNTAITSQNTAIEAIELTTETNIKVANMERRLKALESNHTEFSTQSDKTNNHIHDI